MRRPNLLFIMADQLAGPALPLYGHGVVKAPHLTALGEAGVVFDAAYCASPLCAPSRYAMMAGKLPSGIGAYDNAAEFPADTPTFAHYLRLAGYRTALAGKMHFCGPDQLHGFEERLTTDIYPADYGWTPDWDHPEQRPSWYHNMLSVVEAGPCVRSNQLDYDEDVVFAAGRHLFDMARDADDRPFCLVVSLTHPHDPYAILPEYWGRYDDSEIDLPSVDIAPADQDPHSRRLRHVSDMDRHPLNETQKRRARRAYYGAISYVDDQVGRLMRVLQDCGFADDTVTIFAADHGDMLGERGLWYKMTFFEWAARVPLIVHAPRLFPARRVSQAVSLLDLLPTFAELAGDGAPPAYAVPIDGQSLLPHLTGKTGHDLALGEYLAEGAVAPILMLRRDGMKYVRSAPDPEMLFDLRHDPQELDNLASDPRQSDRIAGFRAETARRCDEPALHDAVVASQRRRRLVYAALMKGAHTAWEFQPYRDASRQYMRNHLDLDDLERRSRLPPPSPFGMGSATEKPPRASHDGEA